MSEALTVGDVARAAAGRQPHRVALDDGERQVSYAELDTQADALARAFLARGIAVGDVVCAFLPNCIEYVIVVLAAARAGAVFCPVNARYKARETAAILGPARPKLVVTVAEHVGMLREALAACGCEDTHIAVIPAKAGIQSFRLQARESREPWIPASAGMTGEVAGMTAGAIPEVAQDATFSLMFTSGTTGQPKGALATHRARMTWVRSAIAEYGITEDDVYLGTMPQVHSAGLTFTLIHLQVGATVRILPKFDPCAFLDIVEREGATSLLVVPTMLAGIMDALDAAPQSPRLSGVRRLLSCGAPLPLPLKQRVLHRFTTQLYDYYGATESNSITVLRPAEQWRKPRSVGQAFRGVALRIADADGNDCPAGSVGEVWCRNPSSMTGYLAQPEATARVLHDGWYRTGDLGWLDGEGFLHLAGRERDVVISGGVNIYPAEIEQVLLLHPQVQEAAVVGQPDPRWGEVVKAFVVTRGDVPLELDAVQAHCAAHLADFKKPRALQVVTELPKNASGKILKTELRALA